MQKNIFYTVIMLVAFIVNLKAQTADISKNSEDWSYRETVDGSYRMGSDTSTEFSNQNVLTIKSIKKDIKGFGNIMQTIQPDLYLGKTIKMSGYVKSEDVKSWAGLWMRVDFYKEKVLAFDNMQNRAVKGTTDWIKYEVVLFVPNDATSISYGVLLHGKGQIWFKDVIVEVVEEIVQETGTIKGREQKPISFEIRAKQIGDQIASITNEEKNALKVEIDKIDNQVSEGTLSKNEADELKLKRAKERAKNIESRVAVQEEKLNQLIQDKIDGKISDNNEKSKRGGISIVFGSSPDSIGEFHRQINLSSMKVYNGADDFIKKQSKRTTSQFVFALGLNNLITEGENIENSDFRVAGSHFYEWGLTYNTRILKNANLLHVKYGLSVMYNNLRPTNNRFFVKNGNQTELQIAAVDLKESRLRNVQLVFPLHLEFDFTPKKLSEDGKTYFRTHNSFRVGLGGYGGFNIKSKQITKYELDGDKIKDKQKGDFNTSNFVYGLSTYVGYKATSLYVKYDINPLFKNNTVDQNNISLGIRFDFN